MTHVKHWWLPLIVLMACSPSDRAGLEDPGVTLVRHELPELGSNGPELRRSAVAVSAWGHLAFTSGFHDGPELITITDSTGRVIARTGRRGGGPGELDNAYYLFFQDSTLHVADVFQGRLLRYGLDGTFLGPVPFGNLLIPIGHVPDSVDVTESSPLTGTRVLRRSLDDSTGHRELIPRTDSILQRLAAVAEQDPFAFWIGFGSTLEGALVADGINYELFAYGVESVRRFGRSLPVQSSLEEPADTLSYFGSNSFGIDRHGRVWAVGRTVESGFIDAYSGTDLIHHVEFDCRPNKWYSMSLVEDWLAVLCDAAEDAPVEVSLRIFRIEG